jgi:hypothetical protein
MYTKHRDIIWPEQLCFVIDFQTGNCVHGHPLQYSAGVVDYRRAIVDDRWLRLLQRQDRPAAGSRAGTDPAKDDLAGDPTCGHRYRHTGSGVRDACR